MSFIAKLKSAVLPPLLIVGGAVVGFAGYDEMKTSAALADHGVATQAMVEEVTWKKKTGIEKNFKAKVVFHADNGQDIHATVGVSKALGQQLRDDAVAPVLEVKYLPENPRKVELADHKDASTPMFLASAAMVLIGGGILVYRRKKKASAAVASA